MRLQADQWSFCNVARRVDPELLDELPFDDPEAIRSRRELGLINWLMGNFRWIREELEESGAARVVELGSGDGAFLKSLADTGLELVGIDLAPRPDALPGRIDWVQGDAREVLGSALRPKTVVVANHLLHQFEDEELAALGAAMQDCEQVLACEPLRALRTRVQGVSLWPLLNRVTRYDMLVSIRAGFRRGELPELLGLEGPEWAREERCTGRGAYRLSARRVSG